jgi:hypothetical protein
MTLQEALRTGNRIRRTCWHPDAFILFYEGNTFLSLSSGDVLAYDWESDIIELPRPNRLEEKTGQMVTSDPPGKTWNSRRGVWV